MNCARPLAALLFFFMVISLSTPSFTQDYLPQEGGPPPEACYLEDAYEEVFWWSVGTFTFILCINNATPFVLNFTAWGINKMMHADQERHPWVRKMGDFISIFTDTDRNGEVHAREFSWYGPLVNAFGFVAPFVFFRDWIVQIAKCQFARDDYKFQFGEYPDDDF